MTTPCYYCERPESDCKFCIHSDTYEEPPQIKELSADEMYEVAKKFLTSYDLEVDQGLYGDTSTVLIAIEDWYGFARAILKKASGK